MNGCSRAPTNIFYAAFAALSIWRTHMIRVFELKSAGQQVTTLLQLLCAPCCERCQGRFVVTDSSVRLRVLASKACFESLTGSQRL